MSGAAPLAGLVVLDFGHTVMGPSCRLILADLGAEVIRVEPAAGGPTRSLKGFGTGYFGFFNRNKGLIAIDLKSASGREIGHRLLARADILIENFAPGAMDAQRILQSLSYDNETIAALREAGIVFGEELTS